MSDDSLRLIRNFWLWTVKESDFKNSHLSTSKNRKHINSSSLFYEQSNVNKTILLNIIV